MLHRILLAAACAAGLAAADAIAEERSSGCGAPPPERPPESFHVGGRERHAIVVLPEEYRADLAHALIFGFHGRTSPNVQARRYFGLEEAADRPAIYVYPAALTDRTGRFTWADPGDPPHALRDFALFDVIFQQMTAAYCVDLDAVYAVGHSLGASFANSPLAPEPIGSGASLRWRAASRRPSARARSRDCSCTTRATKRCR